VVEGLTGTVGADGAPVGIETDHEARRVRGQSRRRCLVVVAVVGVGERCAGGCGEPFGDSAGVVEAGAVGGDPERHRRAGRHVPGPVEARRARLELGEGGHPERTHPHEHPGGAAQPEVGGVELALAQAGELHPAAHDLPAPDAEGVELGVERRLEAGGADHEGVDVS